MNITETNVQVLPLKDLHENKGQIEGLPANPRILRDDKYKALLRSLQEDDLTGVQPLKVYNHNGQYIVLGGNMRLKALRELKRDASVSCLVVPQDTPTDILRKIVIIDNSTFGEWDFDMLANEWDADELNEWGVSVPEVANEGDFGTDFSLSSEQRGKYRQISFQVTDKQADLLSYALSAVTYSDVYQEFDKDGNENDNGNAIALFASLWVKESIASIGDLEKERAKALHNIEMLKTYLRDALQASGKPAKEVDNVLGTKGMSGHYFGDSQWLFPTREAYEKMRTFMELPKPYEECALMVRRCNYILNLTKK